MMEQRQYKPFHLPQPTKPLWVPFPGTKRKAETDILEGLDDEECRPTPRKLFAMDDRVAPYIIENGKLGYFKMDLPPGFEETLPAANDEEMTEENSDPSAVFNDIGEDDTLDEDVGDGNKGGGKRVKHEHDCDNFGQELSISKHSPKLFLHEDAKAVLKNRSSDDLILTDPVDRILREEKKAKALALVLWKPPISNSSPLDDLMRPPTSPEGEGDDDNNNNESLQQSLNEDRTDEMELDMAS